MRIRSALVVILLCAALAIVSAPWTGPLITGGDTRALGEEIIISSNLDENDAFNISMASSPLGDIYVVWDEMVLTNREIHLSYSHDGGRTWSATLEDDVISYNNGQNATSPAIVEYKGNVYAVWQEDVNGRWHIMFGNSSDGGVTWSSSRGDNIITNPEELVVTDCIKPRLAVDSLGVLHMAWMGFNTSVKQWEAYYAQSKDGGVTWSSQREYTLVSDTSLVGDVQSVDIVVDRNDVIYVFWNKPRGGSYEVFVSVSKDGGVTWALDMISYPDGYDAMNVSAAAFGTVVAVWEEFDDIGGTVEIHYSTYDGVGWSGAAGDAIVSYPDKFNARAPAITVTPDDGVYHVVWSEYDYDTGVRQLHYSNSTDGGFKWSSAANGRDYLLTNSLYSDYDPTISPGPNGDFYVAWREWEPPPTRQKGSDEVHWMSIPGNIFIPEMRYPVYISMAVAVVLGYGVYRKRRRG